jgi:hypothetical protein
MAKNFEKLIFGGLVTRLGPNCISSIPTSQETLYLHY